MFITFLALPKSRIKSDVFFKWKFYVDGLKSVEVEIRQRPRLSWLHTLRLLHNFIPLWLRIRIKNHEVDLFKWKFFADGLKSVEVEIRQRPWLSWLHTLRLLHNFIPLWLRIRIKNHLFFQENNLYIMWFMEHCVNSLMKLKNEKGHC